MDPIITFLIYMVIIIAVSLAGAYLPFVKKMSDKQIHLLIALSAGIFLGILFLMLLPEAMKESAEANYDPILVMGLVLAGFLLILAVDLIMKHYHMQSCGCECCQDEHSHNLSSLSAFIGLSVHAAIDGVTLAAAMLAGESVGFMALVGMCIHKVVVLFSLGSTFLLTDRPKKTVLTYLVAFSLITPIAGIISFATMGAISLEGVVGLPIAFAAGTFMFVALCDMLPEAFHRKSQDVKSFLLVIAGIVLIAAVVMVTEMLGAHIH
jgi:zinc transporter ZupT